MPSVVVNRRMLQVSGSINSGSLIVAAKQRHCGEITTIYLLDEYGQQGQAFYASIQEYRSSDGEPLYAAVFPTLAPGSYQVAEPGYTSVNAKSITVFPGNVAHVRYL